MRWFTEEITDKKTGKRKTVLWYFLNDDTVLVSESPSFSEFLEPRPAVIEDSFRFEFQCEPDILVRNNFNYLSFCSC